MRPWSSISKPTSSPPSPSVFGLRPTATSNRSHVSEVVSSPCASVSFTFPSRTSADSARVSNENLSPCFSSTFCKPRDNSRSIVGVTPSKNSTTCTSAPRRCHTDPNSRPIAPAPITIIFSGTASSDNASVELITYSPSKGKLGNAIAELPVAIKTRAAE